MNCYLSDTKTINKVLSICELSLEELELIVGRFNKNSARKGLLRGELCEDFDGSVYIRHHFTKKVLWRKE